jgi:hypothetical protein
LTDTDNYLTSCSAANAFWQGSIVRVGLPGLEPGTNRL